MTKKEKMHDFGSLGKWSEGTLKEHTKRGYYRYQVGFIEDKHLERKTQHKQRHIDLYHELKAIGKMYEDYNKYREAMHEIFMKKN